MITMSSPSSPRWLRAVMCCDRTGSSWYIGAGFFFAPIVVFLDPWPAAVIIAWAVIALSGLWLGILGILMAVGLSQVLRAGETLPDEYWQTLLGYASKRQSPISPTTTMTARSTLGESRRP